MNRFLRVLKKALFPGTGWVVLIVLGGIASLVLAFGTWLGSTPFAYCAYAFSFYALIAAVAAAVRGASPAAAAVRGLPVVGRYLQDQYYKVWLGLRLSFLINLLFALLKLGYAVRYASFWAGGLAVYYILLCVVRLFLLRRVAISPDGVDLRREWKGVRTVGLLLFVLNVALAWISAQIVLDGQGYRYPGLMIYTMATYAFYCLGLSIWGAVKYRRLNSPLLSAAKSVNLTCALVSIFSLETAMLTEFGGQGQERFRTVMTGLTGAAVCLAVLAMAILMVRQAGKNLKDMEEA